jgi:hypothetical protein
VLFFESRFESGNLKRVIQIDRNEYELILKPDHGTKGNTQWFYFKMSNTRRYREYVFHIINFLKPDSQFNDGMMPLFYSAKEAKDNNIGWYRAGYNIAYYASNSQSNKADEPAPRVPGSKKNKDSGGDSTQFYTLSFKFTLKHDDDDVYVAMCYPYTYTDCVRFLDGISGTDN